MNSQHHDSLVLDSKINGVWETGQHSASCLTVNLHEGPRVLGDAIDNPTAVAKLSPRPVTRVRTTALLLELRLRLAAGRQRRASPSAQKLAANLGPRNGGTRITLVFDPTAIELGTLFVGELKHGVALRVAETLPQGDRDLRTVVSGEL